MPRQHSVAEENIYSNLKQCSVPGRSNTLTKKDKRSILSSFTQRYNSFWLAGQDVTTSAKNLLPRETDSLLPACWCRRQSERADQLSGRLLRIQIGLRVVIAVMKMGGARRQQHHHQHHLHQTPSPPPPASFLSLSFLSPVPLRLVTWDSDGVLVE